METQSIGPGVGQPYCPYIAKHGRSLTAVRLAKTNPAYEGYHDPFYVRPQDADNYGEVEVAVYFTGHDDTGGKPTKVTGNPLVVFPS